MLHTGLDRAAPSQVTAGRAEPAVIGLNLTYASMRNFAETPMAGRKYNCKFAAVFLCLAAAQAADVPSYDVARVQEGAIVVDGRLDEAAWKNTPAVHFVFPWEQQTGPKQQTAARLLWDSKNLYVGYECEDTEITAQFLKHDDPVYRDDAVEIFINPNPGEGLNYYGLEMNARAVLFDYLRIWPKLLIARVDLTGVQLATHLDGTLNVSGDRDRGWSLEVAIPWENFRDLTLALPPQPGAEWRINLNRWDGVEPHRRLSQWSNSGLAEPDPHNPERFGRIRFR